MANIYKLNGLTLEDAAKTIRNFLEMKENMDTQCLTSLEGVYIVQARARHGKAKKLLGLDKVISVKLSPIGNDFFSVETGEAKWIDKGVALAVSYFVLWPLALTSGFGIYKQKTLPDKIYKEVSNKFVPECKVS